MATARSTTARNLRVAETYTDMRGEGVKKRVRAARNNRSRAALPDKCRSNMHMHMHMHMHMCMCM